MQIYLTPHPNYYTIPVTQKDKDTYKYVRSNSILDGILENYEVKKPQKLEAADPLALKGTNDLLLLGLNSLQNIHATLRKNFWNKQCFTQISDTVLLVTNPNREIEGLYNSDQIRKNKQIRFKVNKSNEDLIQEPHLFKIGSMAEFKMKQFNHSAIILQGEKGSGKSYQCEKLLNYLLKQSQSGTYKTAILGEAPIQRKTIDTNVIINAFGTALLENNQTSSRYGKYITLFYEMVREKEKENTVEVTNLAGASVEVLLLEYTRITHGEQNFQIFSYLISASREIKNLQNIFNQIKDQREDNEIDDQNFAIFDGIIQILENLGLDNIGKYNYLKKIDKTQKENAEAFVTLMISLNNLGFDIKFLEEILINLASVLIIGNIFDKEVSEKDEALLQFSKLHSIDNHQLYESLTKSKSQQIYSKQQIQSFKIALARYIYQVTFEKVMEQINKSLKHSKDEKTLKSISIFETLGFEIKKDENGLQHNGFEQLMMNFAYEKILNIFLNHLKKEDQEYYKKQIPYESLNLKDNQEIIELFESNKLKNIKTNCQMSGILDQIQASSQLLRQNPDGDLQQVIGSIAHLRLQVKALLTRSVLKNDEENKLMQRCPFPWFMIQHTSGNVYYAVENFGEKNQETLNSSLLEVISKSKIKMIQQKENSQTLQSSISLSQGKSSNRLAKFTTSTFKSQLKKIEAQLESIPLFFVICLKTKSDFDKTVEFDDQQVIRQIKYNSLDSVIQIQLQKYQIRMSHQEFINKYNPELKNKEEICQFINNNDTLTKAIIQVGNTDVLMKPLAYLYLEQGGYRQQQVEVEEQQQGQKQEQKEPMEIQLQRLQDQVNNLQIEKEIENQKRISAQNDLRKLEEQVQSLKSNSQLQKLVDNFCKQVQNLSQESQEGTPKREPLQRESISQIQQNQQLDQSFLSENLQTNNNQQQKYIPEIDQLTTAVSEYIDLYLNYDNNEEQFEQSKKQVKERFIQLEGYLKQYGVL